MVNSKHLRKHNSHHIHHRNDNEEDSEEDEGQANIPTFTIPLKPLVSAELANPPDLCKVVENEYATRLLEHIGASASKANLEMVRKYVPIDKDCLKVSARKKGHSKDQVEVTPPSIKYDYKVPLLGSRAKPHEMLTLGMMEMHSGEQTDKDLANCFGSHIEDSSKDEEKEDGAKGQAGEGIPPPRKDEFQKKGHKFLYPYNLSRKPPKGTKELLKSLKGLPPVPDDENPSHVSISFGGQGGVGSHPGQGQLSPGTSALSPRRTSPPSRHPRGGGGAPVARAHTQQPSSSTATRSPPPLPPRRVSSTGHGTKRASLAHARSSRAPMEDESMNADKKDEFLLELDKELSQAFEITDDLVLHLQEKFGREMVEWKKSCISEATLKKSVSDEEFYETIGDLGSDLTVRLFRNVALVMYHTHLAKEDGVFPKGSPKKEKAEGRSPKKEETEGRSPKREGSGPIRNSQHSITSSMSDSGPGPHRPKIEHLRFKIHQDYAQMCQMYRKKKAKLFFTMPAILLSLRSMVESLFAHRFPLWETTPEGREALHQMDAEILSMVDPHNYYSELSLFQSAPAAIHILQRSHKQERKKLAARFYNTSPLTRAVLGNPQSSQARKLMGNEVKSKTRLAGGYGRTGSSVVEMETDTSTPKLSDRHRAHLYQLNEQIHQTSQPYQGMEFLLRNRSDWLTKQPPYNFKKI